MSISLTDWVAVKWDCELDPQLFRDYVHGMTGTHRRHWFLIEVKGGKEDDTAERLENWGVDAWSPKTTIETIRTEGRKRRGKPRQTTKEHTEILVLPGFVLVNINPTAEAYHALMAFKGVVGIHANVMNWNGATNLGTFPAKQIDRIRGLEKEVYQEPDLSLTERFRYGDAITIAQGPFTGYTGRVVEDNLTAWILRIEIPTDTGSPFKMTVCRDDVELVDEREAA